MQLIAYILIYPILWLVSMLPFRLLYGLSDILCFWLYRVFGYRKSIVKGNLRLVFPDKSEKEISDITKKFYSHFCDIILEAIKSLTIKESEIKKRFVYTNIEKIKELETQNRSVLLMCSHYANWEWTVVIQRHIKHKGYAIYKRLRNKYFDKLVKRIRAKYNAYLVTTKKTISTLTSLKKEGELFAAGFAADQSPKKDKAHYWRNFLGIKAPVITGPEMIAKRLDVPVLFFKIEKVKRGYYEATFHNLIMNPRDYKNYEITDLYIDFIEKQIYEKPEFYLWTHKRWKHKDEVPAEFL
ncbi:lysophospholipid acyltransferase family protein [Winogradskyella echinorum]|uniref:Lysophospholipid acyltransferase family protein n=1 Tax=Winogradskyella echinorum TaxID=538189 RepID=A0ABR6Y4X4_9FLAO|nr:lysophospholipid acyltransferase family protein [Winogradskyella echinorum]MBC3847739.1 lysophospholipid acyltransferase family protein [Winogradskyella echinorum]MBC5752087.1 lysophospholipid acyltransferase family protein [Winogradskyella echinorum]